MNKAFGMPRLQLQVTFDNYKYQNYLYTLTNEPTHYSKQTTPEQSEANYLYTHTRLKWACESHSTFQPIPSYRKTLMRRMVRLTDCTAWPLFSGLLCHNSASVALIIVADISVPWSLWSPHVYSQCRKDDT